MKGLIEILQLDKRIRNSLKEFKAVFTADAVSRIHELVLEVWPPSIDIAKLLSADASEVSGLYIGDYDNEYVSRGLVRHSLYANKILLIDPFIYPKIVREKFNPITNPEQYRTQTLRNVNFWFSMMPWIEAGIVEIIRTPCDFDPQLNWDSLQRQSKKFEDNIELKAATEQSVEEMMTRHSDDFAFRHLLLAMPDEIIERKMKEFGLAKSETSVRDFLRHIQAERDLDPNFLEPLSSSENKGQLHMISSGASYDMALLTARLTGSYLVTDIYSKWREIELDRESHTPETKMWSPFAKAIQDAPFRYLNQIGLNDALMLRQEGRLESLRSFFFRVWRSARTEESFDSVNAQILTEELTYEVAKAKEEWKKIDSDLLKILGTEVVASLLAAGPLIASGHASFLAAAAAVTGLTTLADSFLKRRAFPNRFPAAFFMKIDDRHK